MLRQGLVYFIRHYCRPLPVIAAVIASAIFLWTPRATGAQTAVPPQPKTEANLDTATLVVAPNLSAQLAKFNPVRMLVERGDLPKDKLRVYYASEVTGFFRTVRFGIAEAHGRAEIMEINFSSERGVIARDAASGRYAIDLNQMPDAVSALAKELLQQEATGDRARVEAWFTKYGSMPPEITKALELLPMCPWISIRSQRSPNPCVRNQIPT
jgi:hypothetical protein